VYRFILIVVHKTERQRGAGLVSVLAETFVSMAYGPHPSNALSGYIQHPPLLPRIVSQHGIMVKNRLLADVTVYWGFLLKSSKNLSYVQDFNEYPASAARSSKCQTLQSPVHGPR
jgi:hypothetical protein